MINYDLARRSYLFSYALVKVCKCKLGKLVELHIGNGSITCITKCSCNCIKSGGRQIISWRPAYENEMDR